MAAIQESPCFSLARNIPAAFHPRGFIEFFTARGVDAAMLLQQTTIERALEQPEALISYRDLSQLIHNGVTALGQPGLGFEAGLWMPWCYYGTLAQVVAAGPSLAEVGLAFRRYVAITQPYYFHHYRLPDYYIDREQLLVHPIAQLELGEVSRASHQFEFEYRLATTARMFAECGWHDYTGHRLEIHLRGHYAQSRQRLEQLPCTRLVLGSDKDAIVAPHAMFATRWRESRRGVFTHVLELLEQEYQRHGVDDSFAGLVRWHIAQSFIRRASLETIADTLGVSPRSVARKLASENTSFRALLHEVKMTIACQHLRHSHLCVEDIAFLLGFSCSTSMRRALKKWTGRSIGAVRAEVC